MTIEGNDGVSRRAQLDHLVNAHPRAEREGDVESILVDHISRMTISPDVAAGMRQLARTHIKEGRQT